MIFIYLLFKNLRFIYFIFCAMSALFVCMRTYYMSVLCLWVYDNGISIPWNMSYRWL